MQTLTANKATSKHRQVTTEVAIIRKLKVSKFNNDIYNVNNISLEGQQVMHTITAFYAIYSPRLNDTTCSLQIKTKNTNQMYILFNANYINLWYILANCTLTFIY